MIKEYFKSWTRFEIFYVLIGSLTVLISGIIFKSEIAVILSSIMAIVTAILQAKGKIESQFTSILNCLLYSYIAYKSRYFGEVIFYMLIMLPMAIGGIISWKTHKSDKTDTVEVNEIKKKEWIILAIVSVFAFIGFYNILKIFDTSELVVSTFSMLASMLAIYLLVRRSKYGFIFYLLNDIICIILWGIPVILGQFILIPMIIDPICMLINDTYGIINWNRIENKQNK